MLTSGQSGRVYGRLLIPSVEMNDLDSYLIINGGKMKSRNVVVVLLGILLVILCSSELLAARRTSLAGNLLIEDKDDIFLFPQLVLDYRNLISVDYGAGSSYGNGILLFGSEDMGFGVAVHRSDPSVNTVTFGHLWDGEVLSLQGPFDPWQNDNPGQATNPFTVFDLLFSSRAGSGIFGARLAIGNDSVSFEPSDDNRIESSSSQTFVFLSLGYTLTSPFKIDASLGLFLLRSAGQPDQ